MAGNTISDGTMSWTRPWLSMCKSSIRTISMLRHTKRELFTQIIKSIKDKAFDYKNNYNIVSMQPEPASAKLRQHLDF